jgi:hypothetical protein
MDLSERIVNHWSREKGTYYPIIGFVLFLAVLIVANVISNNIHLAEIQSRSILTQSSLPSSDTVSEDFQMSQSVGPHRIFILVDRWIYKTGLTLGTCDVTLKVYAKMYPASSVMLGGNMAAGGSWSRNELCSIGKKMKLYYWFSIC